MPMHRERHNALELGIRLTIKSPLLIKSGGISTNPSLPYMQFVRTFVNGAESIYVPGSSLKGIFRSYVEKVLRTKKGHEGACDIVEKEKSCNKRLEAWRNVPHLKVNKMQFHILYQPVFINF